VIKTVYRKTIELTGIPVSFLVFTITHPSEDKENLISIAQLKWKITVPPGKKIKISYCILRYVM